MYDNKYIHVGEIFVSSTPTEINTILGSCVAICLFDKVEEIGAMNHYLVPLWNENGLQSPKYGNISIPKMIDAMLAKGCKIHNMEAKVFGGANVIDVQQEAMMIGRKNIIIAKEILNEYKIKITGHDVAGTRGRRIMMQSDTGKIFLKYTKGKE